MQRKNTFQTNLMRPQITPKVLGGSLISSLTGKRSQLLFLPSLLMKIENTLTPLILHGLLNIFFGNTGTVLSQWINRIAGSPSEFLKGVQYSL